MIKRLSHVAIAVPSIDQAAKFYEQNLGLRIARREDIPARGVRVAFIPVGDACIELIEPNSPSSPVAGFLEKRGPGLHHICFETEDCQAELSRLRQSGIRLINDVPTQGAHGAKVGFIHPSAASGVLIELTQPAQQ